MVLYINKQRRARSLPLSLEAVRLWNLCIRNHVAIQATYLPTVQNSLVDNLSKHYSADYRWEICNSDLSGIFIQGGIPPWDIFVSQINRKLPYCSRIAMGHDSQSDTLLLPWTDQLRYVFLLFPLLPRVLRKICHNKARVILISLNWPREFWFPELLKISIRTLIRIHPFSDLLNQEDGKLIYPNPDPLHFTTWYLDGHVQKLSMPFLFKVGEIQL